MSLDIKLIQEIVDWNEVYEGNVTSNLVQMAKEAKLYHVLWRPHEMNIKKGEDAILFLTLGLLTLIQKPNFYKTFNPQNGWGDYETLLNLTRNYLKACIDYPDAKIEANS